MIHAWPYVVLPLLSVGFFYSYLLLILSPVPLVYGYIRYGRFKGTLMILFSLLIANVIKSNMVFLLYALILVPLTIVFSESSLKKNTVHGIFLKSTVAVLVSLGGALVLFSKGTPYAFLDAQITSFLKLLQQWTPHMDQWTQKIQTISEQASFFSARFIQEQLVGYLVGFLFVMLWVITIGLKALGISAVSQDLTQWKTPDHLVWVFIAVFFLNEVTVPILTPIAKNVFHILLVIYFLQGMAIATFYFYHKQYTTPQKVLSYTLLSLFPFLTTCFGFFDLWIDFRLHITKHKKGVQL